MEEKINSKNNEIFQTFSNQNIQGNNSTSLYLRKGFV